METSALNLVWANKPGCSLAVAELWLGREQLWLTLFFDESDSRIKIELLPPIGMTTAKLVDFSKAECLIEEAKRDLLAMSGTMDLHSTEQSD